MANAQFASGVISDHLDGHTGSGLILRRATVMPDIVYGKTDAHMYMIPENVPVFTTVDAIKEANKSGATNAFGKRSRVPGTEEGDVLPIVAHIDLDNNDDATTATRTSNSKKLIFVGISYGSASKTSPHVTIAQGGKISIPYKKVDTPRGAVTNHISIVNPAWWNFKTTGYGASNDLRIANLEGMSNDDYPDNTGAVFVKSSNTLVPLSVRVVKHNDHVAHVTIFPKWK